MNLAFVFTSTKTTMENFDIILEKLMLRRNKLQLNQYDKELLAIIKDDLESYKSAKTRHEVGTGIDNKLVA